MLFLLTGFFLFYAVLVVQHPVSIEKLIGTYAYEAYGIYNQDDPVVMNITEYCYPFKEPEDKVECVVSEVNSFFNYSYKRANQTGIRTPSEVVELGGVCRDYAILYDSVFRNLKFKTDFIFIGRHVYNSIWLTGELYCTVDQQQFNCYSL
jgi:hypothetical protein